MKVIFLDIDGVIQPYESQNRFLIDLDDLIFDLSYRFGRDYHKYVDCDVAACYLDWNKEAVGRIKKILDETGAMIVLSSSWRDRLNQNKMIDLFRLWDLDKYYYGETNTSGESYIYSEEYYADFTEAEKIIDDLMKGEYYNYRAVEIQDYLLRHPEIDNFVVIDDINLVKVFKDNAVKTSNFIKEDEMYKCIEILNR